MPTQQSPPVGAACTACPPSSVLDKHTRPTAHTLPPPRTCARAARAPHPAADPRLHPTTGINGWGASAGGRAVPAAGPTHPVHSPGGSNWGRSPGPSLPRRLLQRRHGNQQDEECPGLRHITSDPPRFPPSSTAPRRRQCSPHPPPPPPPPPSAPRPHSPTQSTAAPAAWPPG